MSRKKLFENPISDVNIKLQKDKAELLREIARTNGLALTDYIRSLVYLHISRITQLTENK